MSNPTSANVKLTENNNATMQDALQFDPKLTGTTGTWNFSNKKFRLDIKGNREQLVPLLSLTSDAGQIVVDDVTLRILHFNVPESVLQAALVPGCYFYDFVMYDLSTPPVRTVLMHGEFVLKDGITGG